MCWLILVCQRHFEDNEEVYQEAPHLLPWFGMSRNTNGVSVVAIEKFTGGKATVLGELMIMTFVHVISTINSIGMEMERWKMGQVLG